MGWVAVGVGAAIGAWIRWGLGVLMNHLHEHIPMGTLSVNLLGGYLIGLALAFFGSQSGINPAWKLFLVTGCLGGLTTFSTFSSETVILLQRGEFFWAAAQILLHVAGAIILCLCGFLTYRHFFL